MLQKSFGFGVWVTELSSRAEKRKSFYVWLYWISEHINLVFCSQFYQKTNFSGLCGPGGAFSY